MREVEFLPAWYPQVRRGRRIVFLMAWMTVLLLVAFGMWTTVSRANIRVARATLANLETELVRSRGELKELEVLLTLNKKLSEQAQVLSKVGSHAEAARLLATLDEVMPKTTALLELSMLTEERQPVTLAGVRAAQERDRAVDRRLNVKVTGVAPTDVEVADFLTKLTAKPFFEDVRMTGSKPRTEGGHVMREFEVYFTMNLNEAAGA